MHHNAEAKALQRLLQERESEHRDCLSSVLDKLSLLRSSVSEAHNFLIQNNTAEAAATLGTVYHDCQELCKHLAVLANPKA